MNAVVHNISDLGGVFNRYKQLSGLTNEEVLSKQGGKLAFNYRMALWKTKPAKGAIRAHAIALLMSGKGIKIRPLVKASVIRTRTDPVLVAARKENRRKLKNKGRAMVSKEIGLRSSGAGVLGFGSLFPLKLKKSQTSVSRYGKIFGTATVDATPDGGSAALNWAEMNRQSARVTRGYGGPLARAALRAAVQATHDDIMVYIRRKQQEQMNRVVKAIVGK